MGLEPDRSWVHLKIKSVWLKSITSCKLFLKNHIIQLIYSVLNKSTINKREISTGINHIFNLFWSPVLVESSCMKLRNKKKNFTIAHNSNNVLRRYRCFFRKMADVLKDLPIFSSSSFTGSRPSLKENERRKTKKTKWVYDLPLLLRRNHKIFKDSKWELMRKCVSYLCFKLGNVSIFKG